MATQSLTLPWGKEEIDLALPASWEIRGVLSPASHLPVDDPADEARRSLAEPIGSARLSDLARPGQRVALVVDDGSRPTPVAQILPAVLDELACAGVERDCLTIVPALGLHRAMPAEELAGRLGLPDLAGYHWENPDCDDPARLVLLGATRRGSPVWVNRTVAEADLIVSIGCIEPHIIASFGGGYLCSTQYCCPSVMKLFVTQ
jgi:nickel-dependent lactate racemase